MDFGNPRALISVLIFIWLYHYECIADKQIKYKGTQVWRLNSTENVLNYIKELEDQGDLSIWSTRRSEVDVAVSSNFIAKVSRGLQRRGIAWEIVIPDVQDLIDSQNEIEERRTIVKRSLQDAPDHQRMGSAPHIEGRQQYFDSNQYNPLNYFSNQPMKNSGHQMNWTSYHSLDSIYKYLDYVAQTYPMSCSIETIGMSHERRPLKVLRIGNHERNISAIWIDGGIHAREWVSPAVVTYIIDYLVKHVNETKIQFYIMPMINPDGYEYTFRKDRLWRKNRRTWKNRPACQGVDLNRNFGFKWGVSGTSRHTCSEIYGGAAAFSEPESRAMKNFLSNSSVDFKAYLTFHSFGQFIAIPWGYDEVLVNDYEDHHELGKSMAVAMRTAAGGLNTNYTVGNTANVLSAAAGGSDDWAKAVLKVKYSFTIELPDKGKYGFLLPAEYIEPAAKEALAAVQVVAKACENL